MTQAQLDRSVADRTGESLRTVHRLGFQALVLDAPEPEDLRLVVDCPFCGRAVPYPGRAGDDTTALAECLEPRCDVYFDFAEADVYAASAGDPARRVGRTRRAACPTSTQSGRA